MAAQPPASSRMATNCTSLSQGMSMLIYTIVRGISTNQKNSKAVSFLPVFGNENKFNIPGCQNRQNRPVAVIVLVFVVVVVGSWCWITHQKTDDELKRSKEEVTRLRAELDEYNKTKMEVTIQLEKSKEENEKMKARCDNIENELKTNSLHSIKVSLRDALLLYIRIPNLETVRPDIYKLVREECEPACCYDDSVPTSSVIIMCGRYRLQEPLEVILRRHCSVQDWGFTGCDFASHRKKYLYCHVPSSNLTMLEYYQADCHGSWNKNACYGQMPICP